MKTTMTVLLALVFGTVDTLTAQQNPESAAVDRAMLDKYCVTCHNDRLKTAGLMLDKLDATNVAADAAMWETVAQKLRSGTMPPAGLPRPDEAASARFVASLETALDRAAAADPQPRPPSHSPAEQSGIYERNPRVAGRRD